MLGEITEEKLEQLREGSNPEDGPAHFETIEDGGGQGANHWYRVSPRAKAVTAKCGACSRRSERPVSRLDPVRYGLFLLPPHLKRGKIRELRMRKSKH